jgi:small subunit ribosomal protein S17
VAEETENQNETTETEASEETVSAPEGPVAPAPDTAEPEPPQTEEEQVESPEGPDETVAEAEPVADVEAEAAAAEAPPEPARKPKPKRLPRSKRHKHSKPKRERPAERKPIARVPKPEHERGRRQERRGVVVSSAMDKTIVVRVDAVKAHPKYKKVVRRSTKFHAHDEQNQAKVGDVVRIVETRPLSKTKNWRLAEVLEVAQ